MVPSSARGRAEDRASPEQLRRPSARPSSRLDPRRRPWHDVATMRSMLADESAFCAAPLHDWPWSALGGKAAAAAAPPGKPAQGWSEQASHGKSLPRGSLWAPALPPRQRLPLLCDAQKSGCWGPANPVLPTLTGSG
ncbi:Hypothetical predicted protein [Podarcis lilfordi]|uniref:Uncharacterized protein n=1 Tax=Podarcis lilfordi TaxID=74358 RepID=A0AA35PAY6_9SAUR|nr:Hypothetical predicted protein [Podarcis lilfordi]